MKFFIPLLILISSQVAAEGFFSRWFGGSEATTPKADPAKVKEAVKKVFAQIRDSDSGFERKLGDSTLSLVISNVFFTLSNLPNEVFGESLKPEDITKLKTLINQMVDSTRSSAADNSIIFTFEPLVVKEIVSRLQNVFKALK